MKYEELELGATFETRSIEMTRQKIMDFAQDYDHQSLHLDEDFARSGPFGDIVASGFQTLAVGWNLWLTHGVMEDDGRGGISLDDCRWFEPVFPGDQLRSRVVITELRVTSKGRGSSAPTSTSSTSRIGSSPTSQRAGCTPDGRMTRHDPWPTSSRPTGVADQAVTYPNSVSHRFRGVEPLA